jgi:uncharacterized protein (TIGR03000 family)
MGYGGCYGGGMALTGHGVGGMPMSYGGCYGGMPVGGVGTYDGMQVAPSTTQPEGVRKMPKPGGGSAMLPAPATIVVDLPAEARLSIDGDPTTSTGGQRVFVSPELNPGRDYHYTLKAEIVRDGKPVAVAQEVAVRAGEETQVTLTLPSGVAQR